MCDDLHKVSAVLFRGDEDLCEIGYIIQSGTVSKIRKHLLQRFVEIHTLCEMFKFSHYESVLGVHMLKLRNRNPEGIFR